MADALRSYGLSKSKLMHNCELVEREKLLKQRSYDPEISASEICIRVSQEDDIEEPLSLTSLPKVKCYIDNTSLSQSLQKLKSSAIRNSKAKDVKEVLHKIEQKERLINSFNARLENITSKKALASFHKDQNSKRKFPVFNRI